MKKTTRVRPGEWKAITIEEIQKRFHSDFYYDIRSLITYCEKTEQNWTIDIQQQHEAILIFFVSEDVSWVYEIESEKGPYYRQIYLGRDRHSLFAQEDE